MSQKPFKALQPPPRSSTPLNGNLSLILKRHEYEADTSTEVADRLAGAALQHFLG